MFAGSPAPQEMNLYPAKGAIWHVSNKSAHPHSLASLSLLSDLDSLIRRLDMIETSCSKGSAVAQGWSAWLVAEGLRVRASPGHCVVSLRHINPCLVLV